MALLCINDAVQEGNVIVLDSALGGAQLQEEHLFSIRCVYIAFLKRNILALDR